MASPFIHESAYIDEGAQIGADTKVWHFCHVLGGAVIGERCSLGQNVVVMNGTKVGNNVKVQNNVSIYEGVELEDDVSRKHEYRKTIVRRGATIGANATIVCGTTLGEYSFVGAGAVIADDVLDYALMVGVPARRIGWMCECGARLPDSGEGTCAGCG